MFGHVLQVPLRGHPAFDYKLQAAGHIYNLWTAKGAEPCALASRYASTSLVIFQSFVRLNATLMNRLHVRIPSTACLIVQVF